MNRRAIILGLALTIASGCAFAQTDVDLDRELGGRLSFQVDKKLVKGLHIYAEEEVRVRNNFRSLGRFHTTLGVTYKVHPNIKLGISYALINRRDTATGYFKSPRHRLMLDATGSVRYGDWRFSLKERLQATARTGSYNGYQVSQPAVELKSRLKVQYKGFGAVEPYVYGEVRNSLNAPVISAYYDGTYYVNESLTRTGEEGWFIDGHTGCYINRFRGVIGFDWRIDKDNSLGVALMADWVSDKVIDANATGTRLKSYTKESGFKGWLTVGYNLAL